MFRWCLYVSILAALTLSWPAAAGAHANMEMSSSLLAPAAQPGSASGDNADTQAHLHDEHMHHGTDQRAVARHLLRTADLLAAVLVLGFLGYRYWIWTGRQAPLGFSLRVERRLLLVAGALSLLTGFLEVWLQVEQLSGPGMQSASERFFLLLTSTWIGTAAWMRPLLAGFLLFLTCSRDQESLKWIKGLIVVLWAALSPLTGHAAGTSDGAAAAVGGHLLHLIAAGLWFGGLIGIFAATFARKPSVENIRDWNQSISRFSKLTLLIVPLMGATGAGLAIARLHAATELLDSRYGKLVLLKGAILLVVIGIGVFHRRVWLPRLQPLLEQEGTEREQAIGRFINGVQLELVLALAAFIAAGMLSTTSPSQASAEPLYWHVMGEEAHMSLRIKPESGGGHSIKLDSWLPSELEAPVEPKVEAAPLASPDTEPQSIPLELKVSGPDPYGFEGFDKFTYESVNRAYRFGGSGSWRIIVSFSDSQGQLHRYEKVVDLP
ncbi:MULTISPECIES: copper resistance D family protein [unclassified Paenibacillus]|uniref:copper resistance D family protein n=1 Tax=unclassified Paenibacillus TaxID=185978 RepID=UPI00210CAEC6|nr:MULTISPECIES: CopD family protein [unclassified Paenibacillus]